MFNFISRLFVATKKGLPHWLFGGHEFVVSDTCACKGVWPEGANITHSNTMCVRTQ